MPSSPTFKTSGKAVRVGSKVQVSGKTANDFTKPVMYTVVAADGSKADYTVRVLVSKIVSISGYSGTMVVGSDGSLWGTGRNSDGQLGHRHTPTSVSVPKQVLAGGVAAVSAGYYHTPDPQDGRQPLGGGLQQARAAGKWQHHERLRSGAGHR